MESGGGGRGGGGAGAGGGGGGQGLAVLVQAHVDELLEGIQPSSSFTASSKRKKALAKFSRWFLDPGDPPQLSPAQVETVLVGDALRVESPAPAKAHVRTGLVHLAGLPKRRKDHGGVQLTQSATMAIDFLDKVINLHPSHLSAPIFHEAFTSLPLSLLQKINFDLHVDQQTRQQAFRLIQSVLRHQRALRRDPSANSPHAHADHVLEQLLKDDDAHDLYIEWEDEFDDDLEDDPNSEAKAREQDPGSWTGVHLDAERPTDLDGSERDPDHDTFIDDVNPAKTLLASVLKDAIQKEQAAASPQNKSGLSQSTSSAVDDEAKLEAQATAAQRLTDSFKSIGANTTRIDDPLRVRAGDLRVFEAQINFFAFAPNAASASNKRKSKMTAAATAAAAAASAAAKSATPRSFDPEHTPNAEEDATPMSPPGFIDTNTDDSDNDSLASSPPISPSMSRASGGPPTRRASKTSRLKALIRGRKSRRASTTAGTPGALETDSHYSGSSAGGGAEWTPDAELSAEKSTRHRRFRTFRRKSTVKRTTESAASMSLGKAQTGSGKPPKPPLRSATAATAMSTANVTSARPTPEISQEDRDRFLDRQVMSEIFEHATKNRRRPDSGSFKSITSASFTSKRAEAAAQVKLSLLPSSENFSPSLLLWRVHRTTELGDLVKGLHNLEQDNEDQNRRMRNLVRENFDEFVHCRYTIGQIDALMKQESEASLRDATASSSSAAGAAVAGPAGTEISSRAPGSNGKTRAAAKKNSKQSGQASQSQQQQLQQLQQQNQNGPASKGPGRTIRVNGALDQALETANTSFVPLLQKRKRIRKLRRAADMLQRLEYLWQLPQRLRDLMARHKWIVAVIEFSNVGQLLALLDRPRSNSSSSPGMTAKQDRRTFYHDAVRDLESCGIDLCVALKTKLAAKDGGAVQAASVKSGARDTEHPGNLTEDTDLALRKDQIDSLLCTEALSLLLELRDHVPKGSKLHRMLDDENDPFLMLAVSQQAHGAAALQGIDPTDSGALGRATRIARAYLGIWEDARVCLDPSSASSGKEHIFDVLNRVKGESGAIVTSRGSGGLQIVPDANPDLDADTEVMDELARLRNARGNQRGAGAALGDDDVRGGGAASGANAQDGDTRSRAGSTDLLFDIRKRSAANCTLEDLAERRKSSDEMAWSIISAYIDVGRRVVEDDFAHDDLPAARKNLQSLLSHCRSMRARGAFNAAAHAAKRLERKRAHDAKAVAFIARTEPFALLERLTAEYVHRKLGQQVAATARDIEKDNFSPLPRVTGRPGQVPQLVVLVRAIEGLHVVLTDVQTLVRSTDGLSFWSNAFLYELVDDVSRQLGTLLNSVSIWVDKRAKGATADIVALLFADCYFLRDTFLDQIQALLAEAIQPRLRTQQQRAQGSGNANGNGNGNGNGASSPRGADIFVREQQDKFQRLEDKLMAQYVQQNGQGLKALVDEAVAVIQRKDWPNPPSAVRQYTLDVLAHLVHVMAECSFRVGALGTRRLICGLAHRLGLIFSLAVSAAVANGLDASACPGFALQLRAEIAFLRTVLASFETEKATDAFASTLMHLQFREEGSTQNDDAVIVPLVMDATRRAALMVRALGADPSLGAVSIITSAERPPHPPTPPPL
ncbi:Exocyst complex component SEC5A [Hondaea fermentalgiana]|uniref:Exocyst complex component SEC5A n=1 Tax=Hondaea fermentalgiana TaxID=2315210 RepID=A0A2R5G4W5_9STRA|nr:Exocyst complex component SEC5A [Hondaea fermentalgiana]|eukprot:GBG26072.1 Exocyst complex component SEC5A [Hondaea fermentalgiana]